MSVPSVFKLKYKSADGRILFSKNYYFYFRRKKINTGLTEKKSATAFAIEYVADEIEKEAQHWKTETNLINSTAPTLLEELKRDGWISFNKNNECLYENNPKYKMALNNEKMSYGVTHAKQVGRLLRRVFETYADPIGNLPYNQITKADVIALRERLANYEMPNSMKNEFMKAIRSVYTFWGSDETISFNPFIKSLAFNDFPRNTKDERDVFSVDELRTIFSKKILKLMYPDDKEWLKFLESDYFASYKFGALTGMRSAEIRALCSAQIQNDRILIVNRAFKEKNTKTSSIGKPKQNKSRVIVLCDSAYNIIRDNLYVEDEYDYIFKNDTGNNALEVSKWNKKWVYFIGKIQAKLPQVFSNRYFTPHCLRKTLNTLLINKYHCNNELVVDYLGWGESGNQTALSKVQREHYLITKAQDLLPIAQTIERMYSGREMLWTLANINDKTQSDAELNRAILILMSGMEDEG